MRWRKRWESACARCTAISLRCSSRGAEIVGEAGVGYVLRPGFMLPPLMFSQAETEALVLGMRWVSRRGDSQLASAAGQALAKIADVLPPALREELEANTLLIAPVQAPPVADVMRVLIRDTIRRERKLHIDYLDLAGQRSERLLWPLCAGFFRPVPDAGCLVRAAPGVSPFSPRSHSGRYTFGTALSARPAAAAERVAPQRGHCGAIAARCCHKLSVAPLSLCLSGTGRFPSPRRTDR